MKKYKDHPEEVNIVGEPVVAYHVAQPQQSFFAPIDADDMNDDIPLDADGKPIGYTLDEVFDEVDHDLSEFYGVDFMKITRMIRSGKLDENTITNELLCSPEFKYEPYPGFKPKPLSADFVPDPSLIGIFDDK